MLTSGGTPRSRESASFAEMKRHSASCATAIGTGITSKSANVQQVQIGSLPGEYLTGILFQDEQGNVTWLADDPMATLRWEDGGSTYTLFYHSLKYPLTKEDLVRLAESMTLEPVAK